MKRLVVIGGSGFLGRHLIARCGDWAVTSIDQVAFGPDRPSNVHEIVADGRDRDMLRLALRGATLVWIRAGLTGGPRSSAIENAQQYVAVNTDLVRATLAACDETGVKQVIFDSTEQVWGTSSDVGCHAVDREPFAANFYGASKLMAEKFLQHWVSADADRSVQVFRYARVREALTRDVIHYMTSASITGEPVRLASNPAHRLSFVHVNDVIEANLAALRLRPRFAIYQVAVDRPYSLLEIVRLVREVAQANVPLQFDSMSAQNMPSFEPFVVGMDWEESAHRLGIWPRWGLAAMIEETLNALRSGGS